jgi:hypothetical protein
MTFSSTKRGKPGFVSYVLVLSTGVILTLLMVTAYRRATNSMGVQKNVQLNVDYSEKEDAILRSIVAITPNRAMRAMQHNSSSSDAIKFPLRWQNIFTEALAQANARTSISSNLLTTLAITNLRSGNSGDSALGTPSAIFKAISPETGYVSVGVNRSLAGYPPPLTTSATIRSMDLIYPIITTGKVYGTLAQSGVGLPVATYPNYNLLTYPRINFGYAKPGDPFVARRNWWAFSMDVGAHDAALTRLARPARDFVLSIYEVPSQLAISASSFMALGQYASGDAWQNVTISGGIFAGKAAVEGTTAFSALASRRGMTLSGGTTLGGQGFASNPFLPGVRESYQLTQGDFFPVSLASESGRVAFVPINRGADFFDRFAYATESSVLSPTTWNNYSIGALQCAMRLDITQVASALNKTPTALRFSYLKGGVRQDLSISLTTGVATGLPPGYLPCCVEDESYNFGTAVVDLAYGKNGTYAYQTGQTGSVTFDNARFGDPLVGVFKAGYYKPSYPFEVKSLTSGKICIAVYPQRFAAFLAALGADSTAVNNSLVVNVDYTNIGATYPLKPLIPCTDLDYGCILQECADFTAFPKGFSLVTNLRTYIGDDFNIVQATPPAGYTPASGIYYPPCSLFTPEKRYGVDANPFAVRMGGQIGSLASDLIANPVRPLDSKNVSGADITADRITVNLQPIVHPAELPPITMKNWLVVLEERRKEFVGF